MSFVKFYDCYCAVSVYLRAVGVLRKRTRPPVRYMLTIAKEDEALCKVDADDCERRSEILWTGRRNERAVVQWGFTERQAARHSARV